MNIKSILIRYLARKKYNKKFKPETFKKILIIRTAKIGDSICTLPLIFELKKAFPSARIDIYASTYNNFMFKYTPQVEKVYTQYRTKQVLRTIFDLFRMRSNKYDLIIDTLEIRFSKIFKLVFINANWLIANEGYATRYDLSNSDVKLYYKLTPWKMIHTTDRLLEFLHLLNIFDYDRTMKFPIGAASINYAKSFLAPYKNKKLIGLNADSTDLARTLTESDIINICRGLTDSLQGIKVLLFCSKERQLHMKRLIESSQLINVIYEEGSNSIFDAAALVSYMHVIISPNTSFIHIASAYNIPTVGIYQNDAHHLQCWEPRSDKQTIVKPDGQSDSIEGFSIEETVAAAIRFLD